jgi:stage II sporulation protein D
MPRSARRRSALAAIALAGAIASCRGALSRAPAPEPPVTREPPLARGDTTLGDTAFPMMPGPGRRARGAPIRVAVATAATNARIVGSGRWTLLDREGAAITVAGTGERWSLAARSGRIRAVREDDGWSVSVDAPAVLRPVEEGARLSMGTREYRGELAAWADGDALTIVNRLPIEDYLRGVVPLEIGERAPGEIAAVEAQAIAARSYAYAHLSPSQRFDVKSTVDDQVYGGVNAERPLSDAAVVATEGQVLRYEGRLADTPYHSTCGGSTAEPGEVWNGENGAPYLRRVSDRIPGSDRYYCDPSPRFEWKRSFSGDEIAAAVSRYLRGRGSKAVVGTVRSVRVDSRTGSGRVGTLVLESFTGDETRLRGNEIRYALRQPGGELLNSTYFSVERGGHGGRDEFVLRGRGYGHGIGMCQWGAIGRARAGQDAATILRTYYPGTSVGTVP